MTPYRRRLARILIGWRIFILGCVLFAGLVIAALLSCWARGEHPTPGEVMALAIWSLTFLVGAGAAIFFLRQASRILKKLDRLGGSFSPKTPASAAGGELEEKSRWLK